MEKSLFKFIWRYSKKEQLALLAITILIFPILYLSLELPKRIINDAINDTGGSFSLLGISLSQVQFLFILCIAFLLSVLVSGLLKMRLNTMKGILAERLLRRFRYQLLTRFHRFPRPYFRHTSQGELVSMVTSEAEPMGGLMGDALAQPVFQAGQMLTILIFLFAQSFWFGLASVALIPLQAWLIPMLQRQINQLNKSRIQEVRMLAADIGESAASVSDIRTNGGLRYRMALFSNRLGNLYDIRFAIFQKKFFMKFLNNFINQLTPFFFYLVGGYLAIKGEITVGALVAALAAYKDLTSPWKELLRYYNQAQDMSLRWQIVIEKFTYESVADDRVFEHSNEQLVSLKGDIQIHDVTVRDETGHNLLEDINLSIAQGEKVAVKADSEASALAFADLLTREVLPHRGSVTIAGYELNDLHQTTLANRIGYAHSNPRLLRGTLGGNLLMPLKQEPLTENEQNAEVLEEIKTFQIKAQKSGNSTDPYDVNWINPDIVGLKSSDNIHEWWFQLVEAMGFDDFMVRRALRSRIERNKHQALTDAVVQLRPEIEKRLEDAGLMDVVHRFHPDKFNPVAPLGTNLLYALPTRSLTQVALSEEEYFVDILQDSGIAEELAQLSSTLIEGLTTTFGNDGTDHPLFRRLNMDEDLYKRLGTIVMQRRQAGDAGLKRQDYALMLTVPFAFSAEQFGPVFSDDFKQQILEIRQQSSRDMMKPLDGLYEQIDPQRYYPVMTLLGNAIFGRISTMAGAREQLVEDIVVDVLSKHGLRRLAAQSIYDLVTSRGGENLPTVFRERLAVSRAGIKKPDILIFDNALASHDEDTRELMRERISLLMPDTIKIFIGKEFLRPEEYDQYIEIIDGRIDHQPVQEEPEAPDGRLDLKQKIRAVANTEPFSSLDRKQQRLLAFGAQWFEAKAGQVIFSAGDVADAAYLCHSGSAGLYWPRKNKSAESNRERRLVTEVLPGRVVGDLSLIQDEPRGFDLICEEACVFLRLGKTELLSVIENDAIAATHLLRTVAGHLAGAAKTSQLKHDYATQRGVDFSDFDKNHSE